MKQSSLFICQIDHKVIFYLTAALESANAGLVKFSTTLLRDGLDTTNRLNAAFHGEINMIARQSHSGRNAGIWGALITALVLLGVSQPALAALITRNVNVTLNAANIESYDLDVDLNGTTDFTFTAALVLDPALSVGFDVVDFPFSSNNGVVIDSPTINGFPTASRLQAGATISAANAFALASFDQGNLFFFTTFDPPSGNFGGQTGYLGLRFDRLNETVFGFAEVTVNALEAPLNPLGLTIGTVGFNDIPGQPVQISLVSEPTSMALFGISMLGFLGALRRRKRDSRSPQVVSSPNLQ